MLPLYTGQTWAQKAFREEGGRRQINTVLLLTAQSVTGKAVPTGLTCPCIYHTIVDSF